MLCLGWKTKKTCAASTPFALSVVVQRTRDPDSQRTRDADSPSNASANTFLKASDGYFFLICYCLHTGILASRSARRLFKGHVKGQVWSPRPLKVFYFKKAYERHGRPRTPCLPPKRLQKAYESQVWNPRSPCLPPGPPRPVQGLQKAFARLF